MAACTSPRFAPLPLRPPTPTQLDAALPISAAELIGDPFVRAGERTLYELRLRNVAIADVEVVVGPALRRGGSVFHATRARAESTGVVEIAIAGFWEMTTTLVAGGPWSADGERRTEEAWSLSYAGGANAGEDARVLRDNRQSVISAVAAVRAWAPRLGDTATMKIDLLGSFDLIMAATDELEPGVFRRPSTHVIGRATLGSLAFAFEFWISRDEDRIVLMIRSETRWGLVELELLGFDR